MGLNWQQIYQINPTTSLFNDDLLYLARAPYGVNNDVVTNISNFKQNLFGTGTFHNVAPGNVTLTNPLPTYIDCNTDGGASVILPVMNADNSIALGTLFVIRNTGSTAFNILYNGGTVAVGSVPAGGYVFLYLVDNSTANGTVVSNQYLPLSGGTLTGALNLGGNALSGLNQVSANSGTIDFQGSNLNNTNYVSANSIVYTPALQNNNPVTNTNLTLATTNGNLRLSLGGNGAIFDYTSYGAANIGFISAQKNTYGTGTASQSGFTVTGVATSWTQDMEGGIFFFSNSACGGIVSVNSPTSITLDVSQTVPGQNYTIYYDGVQLSDHGTLGIQQGFVNGNLFVKGNAQFVYGNEPDVYWSVTGIAGGLQIQNGAGSADTMTLSVQNITTNNITGNINNGTLNINGVAGLNQSIALNPTGTGTVKTTTSILMGNHTAVPSTTPLTIDMGGTLSSVAGQHMKLILQYDAQPNFGFGVSSGQIDYIAPLANQHAFWQGATKSMWLDSSNILNLSNGFAVTGVSTIDNQLNIRNASTHKGFIFIGDTSEGTSTSPSCIDMGTGSSSVAGQNLKLKLWNGGNSLGFGISSGQLDYVVPIGNSHAWWQGASKTMWLDSGNQLNLNTGLLLPTTGGTAALLDYYETGVINTNWHGPYTSDVTGGTIYYTRVGKMVTLHITTFSGTATSSSGITSTVGVPNRLFPRGYWCAPTMVLNNSLNVPGTVQVNGGNGVVSIDNGNFGGFTASGLAGLVNDISVTYLVA